jgi:hypothetical protein
MRQTGTDFLVADLDHVLVAGVRALKVGPLRQELARRPIEPAVAAVAQTTQWYLRGFDLVAHAFRRQHPQR